MPLSTMEAAAIGWTSTVGRVEGGENEIAASWDVAAWAAAIVEGTVCSWITVCIWVTIEVTVTSDTCVSASRKSGKAMRSPGN